MLGDSRATIYSRIFDDIYTWVDALRDNIEVSARS